MSSLQRKAKSGTPGQTSEYEYEVPPFAVLGFDPGGTTGWAFAWTMKPLTSNSTMDDISLVVDELTGLHHNAIFELMLKYKFFAHSMGLLMEMVTEPFEFRQFARQEGDKISRSKVELISCEYIGVMKYFREVHSVPLYEGFNAGQAKSYVPNLKLDKMGWLQRPVTPERHKNDALRQVVKYLIVKKLVRSPITPTWRDDA